MKKWIVTLCFCGGSALFLLGVGGCDTLIPEEFKAKTYDTPSIDAQACSMLSRTIRTTASPRQVNDSAVALITARTLASFATISRSELDTLTENQIIKKYYTMLTDSLPALVTDSLVLVEYAAQSANVPKTVYAKLVIPSGAAKSLYRFYFSLQYFYTGSTSNLGEYVFPEVLRSDTTLVPMNDRMSMESLTACTQLISGAGTTTRVLTIRGRYEMEAVPGAYIVRFTLSDPRVITDPQSRGLLYFKLVIL